MRRRFVLGMSHNPDPIGDDLRRMAQQNKKLIEAWRKSGAAEAIEGMQAKNKQFADMFKPSKALTESFEKLKGLELQLRGPSRLLEDAKNVEKLLGPSINTPQPLRIPENPVHETNRKLNDLVSEIEEQRSIQTQLIGVMQEMVAVQTKTDRKTFWIVVLAVVSLILAILLGAHVL